MGQVVVLDQLAFLVGAGTVVCDEAVGPGPMREAPRLHRIGGVLSLRVLLAGPLQRGGASDFEIDKLIE